MKKKSRVQRHMQKLARKRRREVHALRTEINSLYRELSAAENARDHAFSNALRAVFTDLQSRSLWQRIMFLFSRGKGIAVVTTERIGESL